jgi:hypothetical protein
VSTTEYPCEYYLCERPWSALRRRHCLALHGTRIAVGGGRGPSQSWCRCGPAAYAAVVGCAIGWRAGTTAGGAARSCATSARGAPATTRTSRTPSAHRLSGYSRGTLGTHTVPRRPEVVHSLEDRAASGGEPPHSPGAMWQGASPVPVRMWQGASPVPVRMWQGVSPSPGADLRRIAVGWCWGMLHPMSHSGCSNIRTLGTTTGVLRVVSHTGVLWVLPQGYCG